MTTGLGVGLWVNEKNGKPDPPPKPPQKGKQSGNFSPHETVIAVLPSGFDRELMLEDPSPQE